MCPDARCLTLIAALTQDLDLPSYARRVCALLDAPDADGGGAGGRPLLEAHHLLVLLLEFRANPFFRQALGEDVRPDTVCSAGSGGGTKGGGGGSGGMQQGVQQEHAALGSGGGRGLGSAGGRGGGGAGGVGVLHGAGLSPLRSR